MSDTCFLEMVITHLSRSDGEYKLYNENLQLVELHMKREVKLKLVSFIKRRNGGAVGTWPHPSLDPIQFGLMF